MNHFGNILDLSKSRKTAYFLALDTPGLFGAYLGLLGIFYLVKIGDAIW